MVEATTLAFFAEIDTVGSLATDAGLWFRHLLLALSMFRFARTVSDLLVMADASRAGKLPSQWLWRRRDGLRNGGTNDG